jgi:hypothetical protein
VRQESRTSIPPHALCVSTRDDPVRAGFRSRQAKEDEHANYHAIQTDGRAGA